MVAQRTLHRHADVAWQEDQHRPAYCTLCSGGLMTIHHV
jgi:hypothetical protein